MALEHVRLAADVILMAPYMVMSTPRFGGQLSVSEQPNEQNYV
ncbi:hypothetical protein P4S73_07895 [Paraglaciecola sp. Hal342]